MLFCDRLHCFLELLPTQLVIKEYSVDHIAFYHFKFFEHLDVLVYFAIDLTLVLSIDFKLVQVLNSSLL